MQMSVREQEHRPSVRSYMSSRLDTLRALLEIGGLFDEDNFRIRSTRTMILEECGRVRWPEHAGCGVGACPSFRVTSFRDEAR